LIFNSTIINHDSNEGGPIKNIKNHLEHFLKILKIIYFFKIIFVFFLIHKMAAKEKNCSIFEKKAFFEKKTATMLLYLISF
jgi:hypothetical protein